VAIFAKKYGIRKASRHYGYAVSAIHKWTRVLDKMGHHPIPTKSSRPHSHPHTTDESIVKKIVDKRIEVRRSAEVVHEHLRREGTAVSLATVKRTLDRKNLLNKRSPWKRYHPPVERPYPTKAGDLVEIDTIHTMQSKKVRMYTFVLIDVYSRWIYAKSYQRINAKTSLSLLPYYAGFCLSGIMTIVYAFIQNKKNDVIKPLRVEFMIKLIQAILLKWEV